LGFLKIKAWRSINAGASAAFCWFYNGLKTRFQSLRDAFGSPTPVFNESASAHEIIDKSNAFKTSIMLRVQGLSHG